MRNGTRWTRLMAPSRLLWGMIVATGLLRIGWGAALGLGMDEAYHALFRVHPDWSYFDHPPMLALVESLGVGLAGGWVVPITIRLGFILLFAGSTWLMAHLSARFFGPWAGLLAAFALNVSAYHTAAAGAFALPDGPLLFFWLLTLDRIAASLERPDDRRRWLGVGLAWGGAMLSKYHAVFLPAGVVLFALAEPTARHLLRRAGPYLAVVVGLTLFSPVIAWNAQHAWVSFAFQLGRAVSGAETGHAVRGLVFQPTALLAAIGGQAAYLFPWIWLMLVAILVVQLGKFRHGATVAERFLVCQAVIPLTVFTGVACVRPVLPHWTLVGYLSIFPLLGRHWEARWRANPTQTRRRLTILAAIPVVVMAMMVAQDRTGWMNRLGLPAKLDPTADLYGWDQIADEIERRRLLDPPGTFLFTGTWYASGQMAFATRYLGEPVLCYNQRDPHNFAVWSRPDDWLGRDGLLVSVGDIKHEPACFARYFERIEPPVQFTVTRNGREVRRARLFRCVRQVAAFPFGFGSN